MIHTNTVIHADVLEKGTDNHVRLNILILEDEIIVKDEKNNPLLNLCLEQIKIYQGVVNTNLIIAPANQDEYLYVQFNERKLTQW